MYLETLYKGPHGNCFASVGPTSVRLADANMLKKRLSTNFEVSTRLLSLTCQLQGKSNGSPIGVILEELRVCGVQGWFWTTMSDFLASS